MLYNGIFGFLGMVVFAIVIFSVANTILMSIFERTREIGTLMAIGTTRGTRLADVLPAEGAVIGIIGGVLGLAAGALASPTLINHVHIMLPPPPGYTQSATRCGCMLQPPHPDHRLPHRRHHRDALVDRAGAQSLAAEDRRRAGTHLGSMHETLIRSSHLLVPLTRRAPRDAATVLARTDVFRNPMASFSVDVELTSIAPDGTTRDLEVPRLRKGSDRSVVEFTAPQTEKGKFLLMLRDAMWIYMPSASRPIRISPLQRLMGQASNGDVARTNFTVDYHATAVAEDGDAFVLDLAAKDPVRRLQPRAAVDRQASLTSRAAPTSTSCRGKLIKRALRYGRWPAARVTESRSTTLLRPGNRTVMRYANRVARENPEKMFTKDALGKW